VDTVLAALEQYKPDLARVLRLRYVEGLTQERSAVELGISVKTERRREKRAISEFVRLVS